MVITHLKQAEGGLTAEAQVNTKNLSSICPHGFCKLCRKNCTGRGMSEQADKLRFNEENFFDHYKDTGCQESESCLSCPLEQCVEDIGPDRHRRVTGAKKDAERADAVVIAELTMSRSQAIKKVARDYGLTRRTIQRILERVT